MKNKLICIDRKQTRRIIKSFKLVAEIVSIFKTFTFAVSCCDFIGSLFDRD